MWDKVEAAVVHAHGVAWDGCHKIYLAMDEGEADWFATYYPHWVTGTAAEMLDTLNEWYLDSCSLRFIQSVRAVDGDPNDGYVNLISQFEDAPLDDDDPIREWSA